jgi:hypothetical protein
MDQKFKEMVWKITQVPAMVTEEKRIPSKSRMNELYI